MAKENQIPQDYSAQNFNKKFIMAWYAFEQESRHFRKISLILHTDYLAYTQGTHGAAET